MKRIISTSAAPAAVGPSSQGVEASGATLYVSGQLPIDPADGTMPDTVEQQTEQARYDQQLAYWQSQAQQERTDYQTALAQSQSAAASAASGKAIRPAT